MALFHLAQLNIARMRLPLADPAMQGFVTGLDPMNELAEVSPGFVWRLQTNAGDATGLRIFDDDQIIINLSVWESIPALRAYTYQSSHVEFVRKRRSWFEKHNGPSLVMWWVPAGHHPTLLEARSRLDHLRQHGETPSAFSFKQIFPPPETAALPEKVVLQDKLEQFAEFWSPRIVGELNQQHIKLAKLLGGFVWHHHEHEDELFLVLSGRLLIQFRDQDIEMEPGEFLIIPHGVEHRPVAEEECHVLLFEPQSTLNTGNVQSEHTVSDLERL